MVYASVDGVYTTAIGIEMLPNIKREFLSLGAQNKITKINKTTPTMIKSDEESLIRLKRTVQILNDLNTRA